MGPLMIIGKKKSSKFASLVLWASVFAGLVVLLMLFGAAIGLWEPIDGFRYYRTWFKIIGFTVCGISILCFIFLIIQRKVTGKKKAILSLLIGLAILWPMVSSIVGESISYPPIHDISTDTINPPQFLTLKEDREGARNTLVYGGPKIAAQQIEAFPDILPIISKLSPDDAYSKALFVGKAMGWKIIGADPVVRRFEGTATTPFFKFVDDAVVVVSETPTGSRVDIRSVSRIGRGDIGVNAKRIREFIDIFNQ